MNRDEWFHYTGTAKVSSRMTWYLSDESGLWNARGDVYRYYGFDRADMAPCSGQSCPLCRPAA